MTTDNHTPPSWLQESPTYELLNLIQERLMVMDKVLHQIAHHQPQTGKRVTLQTLAWQGQDQLDMLYVILHTLTLRYLREA